MLPFSTFNVLFTNALLFSASSESNNALTICGGIYLCAGFTVTPKGVNPHAEILRCIMDCFVMEYAFASLIIPQDADLTV
jgi:hypothetical protein